MSNQCFAKYEFQRKTVPSYVSFGGMTTTWPQKHRNIKCSFIFLEPYRLHRASANFALRRTTEDNQNTFPVEVVNTVKKNFYVDDCLKSLPSVAVAIAHVNDLQNLLSKGGFKLTKWVSNSREVLEAIPEQERSAEFKRLDLHNDELPPQRALGMKWCIESDTFFFDVHHEAQPPISKRHFVPG